MLRKLLWLSIIILFMTPNFAFAQREVTLEFEGRYWFTDLEGKGRVTENGVGTNIDLKKDLDIEDQGYPEVRLTWHTGPKSKIRIAYTQVNYEGDETLVRTIKFGEETYNVGTRVATDFDVRYIRLGWAWQFINIGNGVVKFGTLLEGKGYWGKATIEAPDLVTPVKESEKFIFGLPTLGVALDLRPHKRLNIFGEASGMTAGRYGYTYDAEAGIQFIPIRILSLIGGYRIMEFKGESDDDYAKVRVHGPFIGATIRF
jgi:hypothetical protein